jgi:hypothetical protein
MEKQIKHCECGCGAEVKNRFVHGHYARLHPPNPKRKIEQVMIECGCGCGELFEKYGSQGRPRKFINGHNLKNTPYPMQIPEMAERITAKLTGRELSPKHCQNVSKAKKGVPLNLTEEQRLKKSLINMGEGNPSWRGGICNEPYCREFTPDFKDIIKSRDNYTCQNPDCWGMSNILTVHHINYIKKDCEPSNLICLCNSCNSRANSDRESWQQFYMEINNGNQRNEAC